jgi:hypothetical protein
VLIREIRVKHFRFLILGVSFDDWMILTPLCLATCSRLRFASARRGGWDTRAPLKNVSHAFFPRRSDAPAGSKNFREP